MNRTPVSDLAEGQAIDQSFRAADKQLRVNRQGSKYILLRLGDRTGIIVAMLWNADERLFDSFDRGDYIHCRGRTQIHNGNLQIIVTDLERMDPTEVDPAEFERFDAAESDRLLSRLTEIFRGLEDADLRRLGEAFLADHDFLARFRAAPAAVSHHHAYPGGLLRHTIDLMELASIVAPRFPQLDRDRLVFGAFLHDVGKVEELCGQDDLGYTDRGQLVGHLVIGIQMLGDKIDSLQPDGGGPFPTELRLHLEHMIVSHHGQLEYGSPKLPVTLEAVALHHLDNLDAKLASYTDVIRSDVASEGNWTNYHPMIGRKLWKPAT